MAIKSKAASPVSTGGEGTHFEQHVDAMFLALLLVRGYCPVLKGHLVQRVCLQTEHMGWQTDDLLVIAAREGIAPRQLAAQIKLGLTISDKDKECRKTFAALWADFRNRSLFNPSTDRLAIFVQQGTKTMLGTFGALLDLARVSDDVADFTSRLQTTASQKVAAYYAVTRQIIASIDVSALDADILAFLRVLHVDSYDLNTATGTTEAFVKALLALSSNTENEATVDATWNKLLEIVGFEKSQAKNFDYADLPDDLRQRHATVARAHRDVVTRLVEHGEVTLSGIVDTIGSGIRINRDALAASIIEAVDAFPITVVSGGAGYGKSAVAKAVAQSVAHDNPCFAFRAEEFGEVHLSRTLEHAQAGITVGALNALLAGQGRTLILVESLERLLEASVRDAFKDLLNAIRDNPSLRLLITCRHYSLETVLSSLLRPAGIGFTVVEVPGLTDAEQDGVVSKLPQLRPLVELTRVRTLLRSPYMLSMAALMTWDDAGTPADEVAFRTKCWDDVVRKNAVQRDGLPRRRAEVFMQLAVRRAQALRPFVAASGLDPAVLQSLHNDGLVVFGPRTDALAAPAHDVLEDWAVIQWLDERFSIGGGSATDLSRDVTPHPAIRRGFRKWLGELLEKRADEADALALAILGDTQSPPYFADDTLTAILVSDSAPVFFKRQATNLLANEARLLVRAIHLLRVAGKTRPAWLPKAMSAVSQMLVPQGKAWSAVAEFVAANLDSLVRAHVGLLVGLMEDWSGFVTLTVPEPDGFVAAGKIAFRVLDDIEQHYADESRGRVLRVIAKIPTANPGRTLDLLSRAEKNERDHTANAFAKIVMHALDGVHVCRAHPEAVSALVKGQLLIIDPQKEESRYSASNIEPFFGIRSHTHHEFFPASAAHGPFQTLFLYHPRVAANLVIDLLNHAGRWYGEQLLSYERLEPAFPIAVAIPDEKSVSQWGNARLWNLYRGTTVGPYSIQCALMALEEWLLRICTFEQVDVEAWLLRLLRESNNVCATSVVASVCIAYPNRARRASLSMLRRELIDMDRARMASERMKDPFKGMFPPAQPEHVLYEAERQNAAKLAHRKKDLEWLILNLQNTPLRDEVWKFIDAERSTLPPVEQQNEGHRIWRLALHRMDLRGYREVGRAPAPSDDTTSPPDQAPDAIFIAPAALEDDVKEMVDQNAAQFAELNRDLALLNWGCAAWEGKLAADATPWTEQLAAAQLRFAEQREAPEYAQHGPEIVAAVCLRDHLEDLAPSDLQWCIKLLGDALEADADAPETFRQHSRGMILPDRCAAFVFPNVLSRSDPGEPDARLIRYIAIGLTHSTPEVREYAVAGVGRFLVDRWLPVARRCLAAVALRARLLEEADLRDHALDERDELYRDVERRVREQFTDGDLEETELATLDLTSWPGREAGRLMLPILSRWPGETISKRFYEGLVEFLANIWSRKSQRGAGGRDYHFEYDGLAYVARFALRLSASQAMTLCRPFLALVEEDSQDVARFIRDLIVAEDASEGVTAFWDLWQAFADALRKTTWVARLPQARRSRSSIIPPLLLSVQWNQGVREWRRQAGHENAVSDLVSQLPPAGDILEAYTGYLSTVGSRALPAAFELVANKLNSGDAPEMLSTENLAYRLETLLGGFTYREPAKLKSDGTLRDSVLSILDHLVDSGSSAAFHMRDDFVTPLPVNAGGTTTA